MISPRDKEVFYASISALAAARLGAAVPLVVLETAEGHDVISPQTARTHRHELAIMLMRQARYMVGAAAFAELVADVAREPFE